jgi:hypothetical protein
MTDDPDQIHRCTRNLTLMHWKTLCSPIHPYSLCPIARVAKEHVSLGPIDIDCHVLSNRIGQNIKLMPHTIETNLGDKSLPSLNRSVATSVCNIVLV